MSSRLSSIEKIPFDRGFCTIKYDPNDLSNAKAVLTGLHIKGKIITSHIVWNFKGLAVERQIELLNEDVDCLNVEVQGSLEPIVRVSVNKEALIEKKARALLNTFNKTPFSRENTWLDRHVRWVTQYGDDALKILYKIILSSQHYPANSNAATNASSIWVRSGFPLSGYDFSYVNMPLASLSGAVAEETNFDHANLEKVDFSNAILNHANLNHIKGQGINFGRLVDIEDRPLNLIHSVVFSPNSQYLLTIGNFKLTLWDLNTGKSINEVRYNSYGKKVMKEWKQEMAIWSARNQPLNSPPNIKLPQDIPHEEHHVLFSNDGLFLITGSNNGFISVRNALTLKPIQFFAMPNREAFNISEMQFSSDGRFLVVVRNHKEREFSEIDIWKASQDISDLRFECCKILGWAIRLKKMCISSQGNMLGTIGWLKSEERYKVDVWSIPSLENLGTLELKDLDLIEFEPQEDRLLIAASGEISSWNWIARKLSPLFKETFNSKIISMQFLSKTSVLGYVTRNSDEKNSGLTMSFRDIYDQKMIYQLALDEIKGPFEPMNPCIVVSSDGNLLAISKNGRRVIIKQINFLINHTSYLDGLIGGINEVESLEEDNCLRVSDSSFRYRLEYSTGRILSKEEVQSNTKAGLQNLSDTTESRKGAYSKDYGIYIVKGNKGESVLEVWTRIPETKIFEMPVDVSTFTANNALAISAELFPYGYMAFADQNNVILWKIQGNEKNIECSRVRVWSYQHGNISKIMRFTKDSSFLLLATKVNILIINVEQPNTTHTLSWGEEGQLDDWFDAISLDGFAFDINQDLCVACYNIKTLKKVGNILVWDLTSNKLLKEFEVPFLVNAINFSADGNYLVAWGVNGVRTWRVSNRRLHLAWSKPQFLEAREVSFDKARLTPENLTLLSQISKRRKPSNPYHSLLYGLIENNFLEITEEEENLEAKKKKVLEALLPSLKKNSNNKEDFEEEISYYSDVFDLVTSLKENEHLIDSQLEKKEKILTKVLIRKRKEAKDDLETADLLEELGSVYLNLQQLQNAQDKFQEALLIYKNSDYPENSKFAVLNGKLGITAFCLKNYEQAQVYLTISARIGEEMQVSYNTAADLLPQCLFGIASQFYEQGKIEEAINKFNETLKCPYTRELTLVGTVHGRLGVCYQLVGKNEDAYQHLIKSSQLDPDSTIYCLLGQYLYLQGNYEKAIEALEQSLKYKDEKQFLLFFEIDNGIMRNEIRPDIQPRLKDNSLSLKSYILACRLLIRCYHKLNLPDKTEQILKEFQIDRSVLEQYFLK